MVNTRFKWKLAAQADPAVVKQLARIQVSPVVAELLANRGYEKATDAAAFQGRPQIGP